ncbi:MAG TPA: molybdopterin-dependent oxidoreductase [Acidobacteriota bacterium]|nr:molybdopterin-dependent oxidoreductase [Acidobacteriota bacterium]
MKKAEDFIVRSEEPLNGEAGLDRLPDCYITPIARFFVRNHGPIPSIDPASHLLAVEGLCRHPKSYRLSDLEREFERAERIALLQCAGNRRRELMQVKPIPGELPWDAGAIGTAEWSGFRLRDVLERVRLADGARHVEFIGLDEISKEEMTLHFGGSIPLQKALSEETLLCDRMNGEPLRPEHGFPLRALVPGVVGARSVKWLARIRLLDEPSWNHWQRKSYRIFPPEVEAASVNWEEGGMLQDYGAHAVICRPGEGGWAAGPSIEFAGYAVPTSGERIERIELSIDGGETWNEVSELDQQSRWGWTLWREVATLPPGKREVIVRAVDSGGRPQPDDAARLWNLKGYMNNSWHRVKVRVGEGAEA